MFRCGDAGLLDTTLIRWHYSLKASHLVCFGPEGIFLSEPNMIVSGEVMTRNNPYMVLQILMLPSSVGENLSRVSCAPRLRFWAQSVARLDA
jgi:hypothetical protein